LISGGEEGPAKVLPLPSKVSEELREMYLGDQARATPERAAEGAAKLFRDLGGKFEGKATAKEIVLTGRTCPWGNETRHAPAACALTKALALALAQGVWKDARVVLAESLANNDPRCTIVIRGPLTEPLRQD
jgi:predicted ArsR family transcriptional regulator